MPQTGGRGARNWSLVAFTVAALALAGCAERGIPVGAAAPSIESRAERVARSTDADPALEARILALDPERITPRDVRDTLAKAPAPQIVLIHGGIAGVCLAMVSTGRFLAAMGYPEERIRHPGDGRWSHS